MPSWEIVGGGHVMSRVRVRVIVAGGWAHAGKNSSALMVNSKAKQRCALPASTGDLAALHFCQLILKPPPRIGITIELSYVVCRKQLPAGRQVLGCATVCWLLSNKATAASATL